MSDHSFDTDVLFDVLANRRRRRLLVDLLERADRPEGAASAGRSAVAEEPSGACIELRHVHLPKLQAAGLVSWDRETNDVTAGPKFERTRPLLRLLTEHAEKLPDGWT